ncbi:pantetheine-phosphate adenylyltransferase [Gloeobacter violaceus]|uniref:Phosphopantetheine adenylyltransferase n=1 Tax=Gloeobacter violaceus (strain ATCC 29082 / PCC 7421) TaxID=251221 RepID=COAD_GLOVI|nr:pantetheine-phosphate adenylyltransferase [Gloeobacter violaceus]Q7NMB9.1 RecName: Full=Phosphopantetheine adenylyltransferase; AltName: Full=Dephospho-CoA pyrophosphorylase; AltName: Full=Pantetheine-phosphate adenylyltransferase; Short=PPAT [Gloeobacter violaceus PCC 7421]BAC88788.1 pantetheine-phosphate adenylyltransferase [Gloeobacter violaceus PCC 7421]
MIALYPGSFDPLTYGHLDIIERAARLFDRVVVAVLRNPAKVPLFTVEERLSQIQKAVRHLDNVEVEAFHGLTVTVARRLDARVLLRGLRAVSDFEAELQMAQTNRTLATEIETLFLSTSTEHSFLSSSLVKNIAAAGGPVSHMVPEHIEKELRTRFAGAPL